jgi:cytidylate kinase
MSYRAIALSQVDGAGGEAIGLEVAQRLGFGYLNEAIVTRVAKDLGIEATDVIEAERRKSFFDQIGRLTADGAAGSSAGQPPPYVFGETEKLLTFIREAVQLAADRGSAVLVAHAASYACADRPDVLRVWITASFSTRAARLSRERGVSEDEAAELLRQSDEGRRSYLERVYGVDRESPTDYDNVINTDRLTREAAVGVIVGLVASYPVTDEPGYGQAAVGYRA